MFEQIGTVLTRALNGCGQAQVRVPVRRHSFERGHCEATLWRKTNWQEVQRILLAAKRYERIERRPGARCGPLGSVAIEVLEYFANVVDYKTGRLEPSIDTLMRRLKRSRDAIVRALKNLRAHGFLDWIRRYQPTGNEGRGPQVRQASNAYRLSLPERAKRLIGWYSLSHPIPDDCEQTQTVRVEELAAYRKSLTRREWALAMLGDTKLGQSFARLGDLLDKKRESAEQAESRTESIRPAPE